MGSFEIILIIAIAIGLFYGYYRGLIDQLTFGAGIVFALAQSSALLPAFTDLVDDAIGLGHYISMAIGFALLLVVSIVVFRLLGKVLSVILETLHLGIVNKIGGALFSAYIAYLVVTAVSHVL